jgi:ferredoxin
MDVTVDSAKCQGHARCNLIAPEVFDLDDAGFVVLLTPHVSPELETDVLSAVTNCPERAIAVSD